MARRVEARACMAALVVLATACAPAAPPRAREPTGGIARCRLTGMVEVGAGNLLFHGATDVKDVLVRSPGGRVGLVVEAIEAGARAHVVARDPPEGPALAIAGYIDVGLLPLHARRDLPIAERAIYIAGGARLRVRSAHERALRVSALYTDFFDVAAGATCDDLALVEARAASGRTEPRGELFHLVHPRARVYVGPGAPVLAELVAHREHPTLRVDAFRRGMRHVRYAHGVIIDAWMNAEDLAAGEGPDCDHCYGGGDFLDKEDRCPGDDDEDGFQDDDGCPGPQPPRARAMRETPVLRSERGPPIGVLEAGAEVWIVKKSGSFARVAGITGTLRAARGTGFWVDASSLPGP